MEGSEKVPNLWGHSVKSPLLISPEQARLERQREPRGREALVNYRRYLRSLAALGEQDLQNGPIEGSIDNRAITRIFDLRAQELFALEAYGSPFKDDPNYKYYMGPSPQFEPFASGWHALSSAIEKLPSLGSLGLGDLCLIRVERKKSMLFTELLPRSGQKVYVVHGITVMEFGQKHLMSCSLMASTHSASPDAYRRGLFCYKCPSGRYMNNFSVQGLLDGGEVLVPPGVVTEFVGFTFRRWMGKENVPCANLVEVEKGTLDRSGIMIEDFECKDVTAWGKKNGYYR